MAAKKVILFIFMLFVLFLPTSVYAGQDTLCYRKAIEFVRTGKKDFAFMYFSKITSEFPDSKFYKDSLFATGEYYFITVNYQTAKGVFNKFINNYPDSQAVFFAYGYLFKIAEEEACMEEADNIRKEIICLKQVSLLFRDFKTFKYLSPFQRRLKALYFIDRIEFYIDDNLFQKVIF